MGGGAKLQKKCKFLHNVAFMYLTSCKKDDTEHVSEMFIERVYICFLPKKCTISTANLLVVITALFILLRLCLALEGLGQGLGKVSVSEGESPPEIDS